MTETTDDRVLVFDWHAEQALDRDSLLTWLVPTAMRQQDMDELSDLTGRFTNCRLTMQLNGVDLNARAFLDGIARNIEHAITREAERLIADADLDAVQEAVEDARVAIRETLIRRLAAAGVEIRSEDR